MSELAIRDTRGFAGVIRGQKAARKTAGMASHAPLVRILSITSCYQCYLRDVMTCVCQRTGKQHPPPGSIPKWCPLPSSATCVNNDAGKGAGE